MPEGEAKKISENLWAKTQNESNPTLRMMMRMTRRPCAISKAKCQQPGQSQSMWWKVSACPRPTTHQKPEQEAMATSAECALKWARNKHMELLQVGTVCWRFGCPLRSLMQTPASVELSDSPTEEFGEPVPSESARFEVMLVYMV